MIQQVEGHCRLKEVRSSFSTRMFPRPKRGDPRKSRWRTNVVVLSRRVVMAVEDDGVDAKCGRAPKLGQLSSWSGGSAFLCLCDPCGQNKTQEGIILPISMFKSDRSVCRDLGRKARVLGGRALATSGERPAVRARETARRVQSAERGRSYRRALLCVVEVVEGRVSRGRAVVGRSGVELGGGTRAKYSP